MVRSSVAYALPSTTSESGFRVGIGGGNRYNPSRVPSAGNFGRYGYTGQAQIDELGMQSVKVLPAQRVQWRSPKPAMCKQRVKQVGLQPMPPSRAPERRSTRVWRVRSEPFRYC